MSDSNARVICPSCNRQYKWEASAVGKNIKCKCGETVRVPANPDSGSADDGGGGGSGEKRVGRGT